ncbi:MAG: hypothetical protein FP826_01550 [Sphingomonadales bacterium]|nr:hypothetical protein [Sphingomonadales bacterium]MBU3993748.1 hypothetical protein [Alphaproteobacteria bacterium]
MRDDLKVLHGTIREAIFRMMGAREHEGEPFVLAAVDVTGILGDEIAILLGAIADQHERAKVVELFGRHLGPAVERAHRLGMAEAGLVPGLQ